MRQIHSSYFLNTSSRVTLLSPRRDEDRPSYLASDVVCDCRTLFAGAQYERHQDRAHRQRTRLAPSRLQRSRIDLRARRSLQAHGETGSQCHGHEQDARPALQASGAIVEEVVRTAEIEVSQSVCNVLFGVNPEYYRMRARLGITLTTPVTCWIRSILESSCRMVCQPLRSLQAITTAYC